MEVWYYAANVHISNLNKKYMHQFLEYGKFALPLITTNTKDKF